MPWGTLQLGGLLLKETDTLTDATNANTGERAVKVEGRETVPGATLADIEAKQEDIVSIMGRTLPAVFQRKTLYNGYYVVTDANAEYEKWVEGPAQVRWSLALGFLGPDSAVDLESRLANVVRLNDFSLAGERWHAPPVGHYSYQVGTAVPSLVSRTSADGVVVVYRSIPAATNPRWGASPANYLLGRVRVLQGAIERAGVGITLTPTGWEMNNALVRVKVDTIAAASTLRVAAWTGAAWQDKSWDVRYAGTTALPAHVKSATVMRNDSEMCTVRLVLQLPADSSRKLLDVSLRRGSRFIECYAQTVAAVTLVATPDTLEAAVDTSASGYMRATSNDAAGNRFVTGSARSFTADANGGISKAATTTLDFFIGVEAAGTGAVAGDQATNLRDQYIGAMTEKVGVARR
jgi:hypothetical protein